jgi:hypothetical protein
MSKRLGDGNLPREKIQKNAVKVLLIKRFEPAWPAVENVLYEKELQEIFSHGKSG